MDEKLLKTFMAVAETESFHRAADRLNITQAAISSRIRTLEDTLKVELFTRGAGGTRLTEAGTYLRPFAEQMLTNWQQVAASLSQQFTGRIALRIGCQLSIWDQLLVDLAIWTEETLGKLPLTLNFDHESNALELLRKRAVDLTITDETVYGTRLKSIPLPAEKMTLVSNRPCSIDDPDLPLFIDFQLGAQYQAATSDLPGNQIGHFFLGNAQMGIAYLLRRGGMAFCPHRMVADALNEQKLFPVTGASEFKLQHFAVYDPNHVSANLVEQVLPGLLEITAQPAQS